MLKIKKIINKLSQSQKVMCLVLILFLFVTLCVGIPTLARYKNRVTIATASTWDGSVASSYRKGTGTESDPYIISNGSELAYFSSQLANNDYSNKYFSLSNDIILNKGVFNYDSQNGIQYVLNNQTYYVGEYSNKYYDNVNKSGTEIGSINELNSLNNFKGHFDGGSFTIYGLYITNETANDIALFTNLQGDVHDLYVEDALIYGGITTAGIAATTNNASLSNILFDGHVVGRSTNLTRNVNVNPTISTINLQDTETTDYIDLNNNVPLVGGEVVSTSITGNYTIDGSNDAATSIKINGVSVSNGEFNINLGNSILDRIPVLTSTSSEGATLTFSNLNYNIVYNYAISGGIVATCSNTVIKNTINKATVFGYSTSGGLVGTANSSLDINQSYNTGNISSQYVSGGLAGTIEKSKDNITISKSYNTGDMSAPNIGGLIGIVSNNTGSLTINNVFNTPTNYSIGIVAGTSVNVSNAYSITGSSAIKTGVVNGSFISTTISNLENKSYAISNLGFNEFVDFNDLITNSQNAWVYSEYSLPILFIDDIANPIADINVNVYSWNNLSSALSTVKLSSNITFSIEATDNLRPLKEIYYYVSNSTQPLTQTELNGITSWESYDGVKTISEGGSYVIYAKVVDYDDNITYINTDVLVLDLSGPTTNAMLGNKTWSSLIDNLNNIYIDRSQTITVEASDDPSGVASIKYLITDHSLSINDLHNLNESSWITYSNGIPITDVGKHIVYVKTTDNSNNITYINSDYIILNGYTENSLTAGKNQYGYLGEGSNITNKSSINLNISYYESNTSDLSGYTHNLISNILLPKGTSITLIDHVTSKAYKYQITTDDDNYNYNNSCNGGDLNCKKAATYPFTLFKEVGSVTDKYYQENSYYNNGTINENFTIIIDLANTNITTNYNNVNLHVELHNSNGNNVRPTLYSTIKSFNIYSNVNSDGTAASLYLSTDYSGNEIMYNSNSTTNIDITSGINYKNINDSKIIDTTYEDKNIGLAVKLVDGNNNIIDRKYLKNIIFKVGDKLYYPETDNIVHIDLNSGISDVTKTMTIIICENNSDLTDGTYYLKVSNYASYDGHYYDELGNSELSIPVKVTSTNPGSNYNFDVIMDDTNRIISKASDEFNVSFKILQAGSLNNPNIRISLYKKDQLTAYNQDYSIVDLANYISDNLNQYTSNIYYVSTNPVEYNDTQKLYNDFDLHLLTSKFENTGYKFVFDLYDGNKKMGTIEKYFIVK